MFTCKECGVTTEDPKDWARVQIVVTHYVAGPPHVSVTPDEALIVLDFHADACRDAWGAKARIP